MFAIDSEVILYRLLKRFNVSRPVASNRKVYLESEYEELSNGDIKLP